MSQSGWMRRRAPRAHSVQEVLMAKSTKSNLHRSMLASSKKAVGHLRIEARLKTNSAQQKHWDNHSKKHIGQLLN